MPTCRSTPAIRGHWSRSGAHLQSYRELREAADAVQHAIDIDPNDADADELLRTIRRVAGSP